MERAEVIDILTRMKALPEDVESLDSSAVTFDRKPIPSSRTFTTVLKR